MTAGEKGIWAARLLYPVRVLGPGERIGLWLSGCHRACPGCSNPELWERRREQHMPVQRLADIIRRLAREHPVDGLTITGGEPFEQPEALRALLDMLADVTDDVLIYTGFTLEELRARADGATDGVLARTAVLIDGPYRQELNAGQPLRGSGNQRIHCFRPDLWPAYEALLQQERSGIQNFTLGSSVVSVGIHLAQYADELPARTIEKGLVTDDADHGPVAPGA